MSRVRVSGQEKFVRRSAPPALELTSYRAIVSASAYTRRLVCPDESHPAMSLRLTVLRAIDRSVTRSTALKSNSSLWPSRDSSSTSSTPTPTTSREDHEHGTDLNEPVGECNIDNNRSPFDSTIRTSQGNAEIPCPSPTPTSLGDEGLVDIDGEGNTAQSRAEDSHPVSKIQRTPGVFKDPKDPGFPARPQFRAPQNTDCAAPRKWTGIPPRRPDRQKGMREIRANGKPEDKGICRFARIFVVDASVTFTDVVAGIAQTAPVGRVLSMSQRRYSWATKNGKSRRLFTVLFDHEAAPLDLVRLASQGVFTVRGETPHVTVWREHKFKSNDHDKFSSRVLLLRGRNDVEDFSEDGIRALVQGDPMAVRALGSLGLSSETVVTTENEEEGTRAIEWRFFDNHKQVRPLFMILRRHFQGRASIAPGRDPCWNAASYPWTRSLESEEKAPEASQEIDWSALEAPILGGDRRAPEASFDSDGRAPKASTPSGPVRPKNVQNESRPPQPREMLDDSKSPELALSVRLKELLKRAQAAREAALRDEGRDLDNGPVGDAENETSDPFGKLLDMMQDQKKVRGRGSDSLKNLEEKDQQRVGRWSRELNKLVRRV